MKNNKALGKPFSGQKIGLTSAVNAGVGGLSVASSTISGQAGGVTGMALNNIADT